MGSEPIVTVLDDPAALADTAARLICDCSPKRSSEGNFDVAR